MVEQVVGSGELQDAEELVVRTARGHRNVPVDDVAVVVPAARLIVVDGRPEPSPAAQHARAIARASLQATRSVAATVARNAPRIAMLILGGLLTLGWVLLVLGSVSVRGASAIARRVRSELQTQTALARRQR